MWDPHSEDTGDTSDAPPQVRSTVQRVTFNESFSSKDPAEFLGRWLGDFAVNFVVPLPGMTEGEASELQEALYGTLEQRLFAGHVGMVKHDVIDYSDAKVPDEASRRYIKVRLHTKRNSEVTTLVRCFPSGAHLYVAADSYLLGRINVFAVAGRALLTLFALLVTLQTTFDLFLLGWLAFAGLLWWLWGDVARAASHAGLSNGLRARYPRPMVNSSFDLDDSLMFLKSLLPLVLQVLKDVGPRYGVDLSSTEELLRELGKKVTGQTITVHNSGTMSGVAIGGSRNSVSAGG